MKIGIAINGEGRGHFSRAIALSEVLQKSHEITFWVSDHLSRELSQYFPTATIYTIPYLKFVQKGFSVNYLKTAIVNAGLFFNPFRAYGRIVRQLRKSNVEAIISDFEPLTSRAAKMEGIPVLQLNHPGVVNRTFSFNLSSLISQFVARYMMANSDRTIICSFFDGDVGPIIRSELRNKKITRGNYFVVYQKAMYKEILEPVLSNSREYTFKIFPNSQEDYATELAGCKGLIAPAGHQSISEALALGKPVFTIPVSGQYEQVLNAQRLRSSGFGEFSFIENITTALPNFLQNIEQFEKAIALNRLGAGKNTKKRCSCEDETLRAVGMIENFLHDMHFRPEWKRKDILAPILLPELY